MNLKKATLAVAAASILAGGGVVVADNQTDPYTDRGDHYEITIDTDIQKGEKVKVSKARPEVTLERWGGEESITVRRVGDYNTNKKHTLSPIRGWKGKGEEVITEKVKLDSTGEPVREPLSWLPKAFAQEATSSSEGFKIDILLDEKPATNVFEYQIEGYEDLDFFYQPPLTETEIAEGAERPENVVGSYAVYHKTKANHKVGSTNYATGKLFHIYRPKVVDADGNATWATLSYDAGILSVTVPQDFLDGAIYPVRVDPTFGYTTQGASNEQICTDASNQANRKGDAFTGADGTITQINAFFSKNAGAFTTVDIATFLNTENTVADSHPLVVRDINLANPITTSVVNYTFDVADTAISATQYILSAVCDGADVSVGSFASVYIAYDSTGTNNNYVENINDGYATLRDEDPWTEVESVDTRTHSIYATYTAAAGGTPTANPNNLGLYE